MKQNKRTVKQRSKDLMDSQNYRVKPYNVLTVSQNFYGKYNTPKGKKTPANRNNITDTPMRNSIRDLVPDAVKLYIEEMRDLLIKPIITKK